MAAGTRAWTGDKGTTSLRGGMRVRKDDSRVRALGEIDELQCCLGVAAAFLPKGLRADGLKAAFGRIQRDLFLLGGLLAQAAKAAGRGSPHRGLAQALAKLAGEVEALERRRPSGFVAPGGRPHAALIHLARAVCRRAERAAVSVAARDSAVVPYLNRLSAYLFLAACRQRPS
ncbi:MAG: cob(I)yrinic acid a,c-diamide adenosyltransferase [Elusimicrobia bacterium]|nr:cob(I)yrinic acid a,c-diamide adenosyltransferase [Elusimicrobiota bacterium]